MPIYAGPSKIGDLSAGAGKIKEAYVGSQKVYSSTPPFTPSDLFREGEIGDWWVFDSRFLYTNGVAIGERGQFNQVRGQRNGAAAMLTTTSTIAWQHLPAANSKKVGWASAEGGTNVRLDLSPAFGASYWRTVIQGCDYGGPSGTGSTGGWGAYASPSITGTANYFWSGSQIFRWYVNQINQGDIISGASIPPCLIETRQYRADGNESAPITNSTCWLNNVVRFDISLGTPYQSLNQHTVWGYGSSQKRQWTFYLAKQFPLDTEQREALWAWWSAAEPVLPIDL